MANTLDRLWISALLLLFALTLSGGSHLRDTAERPRRGRALLVIDVQGCFLPGGALPVQLKDTNSLVTKINTLRIAGRFDAVVFTQDYHPDNHVSFAAVHNRQPAETLDLRYTSDALICDLEHLYPESSVPCSSSSGQYNSSSKSANALQAGRQLSAVAMHTLQQMMWPVHCVQNTAEASLHPGLLVYPDDILVRKGWQPHLDAYSAFMDNGELETTGLADLLQQRGISSVTVVGVALDYCVLWSALDAVKLGFDTTVVLEATAPVSSAGYKNAVRRLEEAGVKLQHSIWDQVVAAY